MKKYTGACTKKEVWRICYLIRAGFTNAMIATVTNVTVDAIAKSKQRMKSKFLLPGGDTFDDFIRNL